jgi:hypothetical protein
VDKNSKTGNSWHGFVWDADIHKYTLTVDASQNKYIMIGFAPCKLFDVSKSYNYTCGWY